MKGSSFGSRDFKKRKRYEAGERVPNFVGLKVHRHSKEG